MDMETVLPIQVAHGQEYDLDPHNIPPSEDVDRRCICAAKTFALCTIKDFCGHIALSDIADKLDVSFQLGSDNVDGLDIVGCEAAD